MPQNLLSAKPPVFTASGDQQGLPLAVALLLAPMVLLQVLQSVMPAQWGDELIVTWGLALFPGGSFDPDRLYTLVTSIFLHDGWLHLFFNGFWIATLGTLICRLLGGWRFVAFFLLCALGGNLLQVAATWGQPYLAIGASGGVFGLLAGFGHMSVAPPWLPPRRRLQKLAAYTLAMAALNFAFAFVGGGVPGSGDAGIAWQAHAGGFLAGLLLFPPLAAGPLREMARRAMEQI